MPSTPPETVEEILATAEIDEVFEELIEDNPVPHFASLGIDQLKEINAITLPGTQKMLAASRPADITETEHKISMADGHKSRLIVCHETQPKASPAPLIVFLHGGGHAVGYPEQGLLLARNLAQEHSAVVVLPSYRLAPEHPFPIGVSDAIDTVLYLATEAAGTPHDPSAPLFPSHLNVDPRSGFLVGGESAGSSLASVVIHALRDRSDSTIPPITGQFLFAGNFISPDHVPAAYVPRYLALEQNADAPVFDRAMRELFAAAYRPDPLSPLAYSFVQHPDTPDHDIAGGHRGIPRSYFQVCGLDPSRDDGLIYERCLREECGIETRLDLYPGWPHCWWHMFPEARKTRKRMADTIDGIAWLLGKK